MMGAIRILSTACLDERRETGGDMGSLRVILALMVVFAHRGDIQCPACLLQGNAIFAVKAFFVGLWLLHGPYHL